jgi:arylsulfatase
VDSKKVPHTTPFIFQWDETFDVGSDTGTSVDDKDYRVPFRFTGKLDKLTVRLGPSQMFPAEKAAVGKKIGARD